MKGKSNNLFFELFQWVKNTPDRAVDSAYKAAVTIKKLEDDYFEGKPISKDWGYANNTYSLFQTQLQSALTSIDIRLAEYKISSRIPSFLKPESTKVAINLIGNPNLENTIPSVLQKLAFIDYILSRYRYSFELKVNPNNHPVPLLDPAKIDPKVYKDLPKSSLTQPSVNHADLDHGVFSPKYVEQTVIPISLIQSLERIRRNLTSGDSYEQDLVKEVRQTRRRINIGIRFITILVVVTISTQQISKNVIYSPIVKSWEKNNKLEFSEEIQERALKRFRAEKEKLEFQILISGKTENKVDNTKVENIKIQSVTETPKTENKAEIIGQNEVQKLLEEKALEIYNFYQDQSLEGLKNLLADITAGFVVYAILITGKKEVEIIKQFLDETIHGLNDNAKAFLIIVTTDTFVGYHSSHGWEVLIDTFSGHFGLPENRDLTLAFIATVPVFLDALIKFWVFQTLTRSSPSTAAIYDEMNK